MYMYMYMQFVYVGMYMDTSSQGGPPNKRPAGFYFLEARGYSPYRWIKVAEFNCNLILRRGLSNWVKLSYT